MSEPERRVRNEDWPHRLEGVVGLYRGARFAWGVTDCGTFFADCVMLSTGWDPIADIRGYHDERSALKRLKAAGFDTVEALVASRFPPVAPALAQRGDLGYPSGSHDRLMSPAVIMGAEAHAMTPQGLTVFPRALIVRAWAV